jgi:hypothetical protein
LSLFETEFLYRFLKPLKRVEKVNGAHDADSLVTLESQQIEVVRDDEVRFAGNAIQKTEDKYK